MASEHKKKYSSNILDSKQIYTFSNILIYKYILLLLF